MWKTILPVSRSSYKQYLEIYVKTAIALRKFSGAIHVIKFFKQHPTTVMNSGASNSGPTIHTGRSTEHTQNVLHSNGHRTAGPSSLEHSPPTTDEVNSKWSYASTPPPPQVTMEWCFSMQPQLPTVSDDKLWATCDTCKYLANVGGSTKSNRDAGYSEYCHCSSQSFKVKTDKTLHQATTASLHTPSNSLLGAFAYSPKTYISFVCLSVCPHASAWLPLDGHPQNLKLGPFIKICQENPN
jgi:hypothetical protein